MATIHGHLTEFGPKLHKQKSAGTNSFPFAFFLPGLWTWYGGAKQPICNHEDKNHRLSMVAQKESGLILWQKEICIHLSHYSLVKAECHLYKEKNIPFLLKQWVSPAPAEGELCCAKHESHQPERHHCAGVTGRMKDKKVRKYLPHKRQHCRTSLTYLSTLWEG